MRQTLLGHTGWIKGVSVTPDLRIAVSVGDDKTLRVWDLGNGDCLHVLGGHSGEVDTVTMTADGRRAISGSRDKTLRIWDLEVGRCMQVLGELPASVRDSTDR